ncbi:MAG: hypothetical protein N2D54_03565 [Chloroflexota bacterium]
MFNDIVLALITPILLFSIARNLYKLVRAEDKNEKAQLSVIMGALIGGLVTYIFVLLNRQVFHFDHWSFDPFAWFISRNTIIIILIAISALLALLISNWLETLKQTAKQPVAAGLYSVLFIMLIYLAYYNLALETMAAFMMIGFMVGVGLDKLFRTF